MAHGSGTKPASATSARPNDHVIADQVGDALLARQSRRFRDPRVDRRNCPTTVAADVRADRHRPRAEDDVGRGGHPREALPDGARASQASGRIPRSPAGAASRRGSRSCRSTTTARRATGWSRCRGRSARIVPDLVSWEWSVANRQGLARLDYTQNASIKTLVAPVRRPAGRRRAGAAPRSPGTSSTTPTCGRTAGRSGRSSPRVAKLGDLFAGALTDAQELPKL